MIKFVNAACFKGRTFLQRLEKANAIVGANFAGKTTITQAIQLALLGYVPEVGKTNAATFTLSSGPKMGVGVEMEDGKVYNRAFIQKADSIKGDFATNDPNPPTEADLPMLNAEAYFGLTDTQRIDYVFQKCAIPEKYTPAGILAAMERVSFGEEHSEEIEVCKTILIADARGFFERAEEEASGVAVKTALTGLTGDKGHLKTEYTLWNRRKTDTMGAVRTMMDLRQREGECSSETLAEIDAALTTLRGQLDAVNQEAGAIQARVKQAASVESRRMDLTLILSHYPEKDHAEEIAELERRLESISALASTELNLEHLNSAKDANLAAKVSIGQVNQEIGSLDDNLASLTEQRDALAGMTACPFCKCEGEGWKANIAQSLSESVERAKTYPQKAREEAAQLNQIINDTDARIAKMELDQAEIRQAKNWKLALENDIAKLKAAAAAEAARIAALKRELASLEAVAMPSAEERNSVIARRTHIACNITEAEAKKQAAVTLQNDLKRAAEAELDHIKACAWVTVIKAMGARLKEIQAEMLDAVFGDLLKTANAICGGILKSPLAFHEGGIGRWDGARFIGHKTFSGSEKALCYVAIAAALSASSPLRLLVLDEMGRLDIENQGHVMIQLRQCLESGVLEQVIVINTNDKAATYASGWNVIRL